AAAVLATGLVVAAALYFAAADEPEAGAMDQILSSKLYTRELQRFGGKASVLFDELERWFEGRWHGKKLGVTVAWLSVIVSGALWVAARRAAPRDKAP
ncbi:MAG: hypothetical protein JO035_02500, partial [Betaproteobacteria bacterium]|nr:hypothetical protein [Betaproteobacteria bacterium]